MLKVHSIETFGTHDGPGIRLVVFVQGCQFRCLYCHNPDTQLADNPRAKLMSTQDIVALLERQRGYMGSNGGLTVSGGEPSLQVDGVTELLAAAQAAGFHTAVDTNGAFFDDRVKQLYHHADLVMLDVKHIDDDWHRRLTGKSNESVLQCAQFREESGCPLWLRYVLVPGWTDQPEMIQRWAEHFCRYQTVEKVEVLPYHTIGKKKYIALGKKYPLEGVEPPQPEAVNDVRLILSRYFASVS
jgi:pyruvate formate lyase activating enzyme